MYSGLQKLFFATAAIALFGMSAPAQAADAFSGEQKTAIETIVKEYLSAHPEVIIESVEKYRQQQEQDQQTKAADTIKDKLAWLTSADAPSIGPMDADVTVVEFFDYNCGYCKRALPDIQSIVDSDKKVRFVFREMPILAPESRTIAQWALAAHKQGKYFEYHAALMSGSGARNEKGLEEVAAKLGLDTEKLKKDANSQEIADMLAEDMKAAQEIGIQGTPAFIINGKMFPGYLGPDGLKQSIEDARKGDDKKEG